MAAETELERMVVRLQGDATGYQRMLSKSVSGTQAAAQQINRSTQSIASSFAGLAAPLATFAGGAAIGSFIQSSVSQAAELETMGVQFETMLQSWRGGQRLMQDLVTLAAQTPLTLPDVTRGARLLLQFGVAGGDVIDTLRMLGDVVGGDAGRLQSMALAFGQMNAAGRLMGQDLLQMVNAGFNPLKEIARTTGRDVTKLRKDMEDGKITVAMVTKAFQSATGAGGNWHNLMERMSKTTAGLFSTMKDDIGAFMRAFGANIIEMFALKDVMRAISSGAQDAVKWLQALDPATKTMAFNWVVAAGAVAGLGVALYGIGAIISIALSPLTMTLALATYLAKQFIDQSGGVSAAWQTLSDGAQAAWEWMQPIAEQVGVFFKVVWDTAVSVFQSLWNLVAETWKSIAGESNVTWDTVRDAIVGAIASVTEFVRTHKDLIVGLVLGVSVVTAFNAAWGLVTGAIGVTHLAVGGLFKLIMTHPIGALIVAIVTLITHFVGVEDVVKGLAVVFGTLFEMVGKVISALKSATEAVIGFLSSGGASDQLAQQMNNLFGISQALSGGFQNLNNNQPLANVTPGGLMALFRPLQALNGIVNELAQPRQGMLETWFRQIADMPEYGAGMMDRLFNRVAQVNAESSKGTFGQWFSDAAMWSKKLNHELDKIRDFARSGSAEALSRIAAYSDKFGLRKKQESPAQADGGVSIWQQAAERANEILNRVVPAVVAVPEMLVEDAQAQAPVAQQQEGPWAQLAAQALFGQQQQVAPWWQQGPLGWLQQQQQAGPWWQQGPVGWLQQGQAQPQQQNAPWWQGVDQQQEGPWAQLAQQAVIQNGQNQQANNTLEQILNVLSNPANVVLANLQGGV